MDNLAEEAAEKAAEEAAEEAAEIAAEEAAEWQPKKKDEAARQTFQDISRCSQTRQI